MNPADSNLTGIQRRVLYSLEKRFGAPLDYYRLLGSETNIETGARSITRKVINVPRAVILPTRIRREAERSISVISADKKFVQGGGYDIGVKQFIIRGALLSEINGVQLNDWIVYKSRRFDVVEFDEYEFSGSYLITAREAVGSQPRQLHNVTANQTLTLGGAINV